MRFDDEVTALRRNCSRPGSGCAFAPQRVSADLYWSFAPLGPICPDMNENRRLEGNQWLILTRVKTAISSNLRRKCLCPKMCRRQSALSFAGRETIPPAKGRSDERRVGKAGVRTC